MDSVQFENNDCSRRRTAPRRRGPSANVIKKSHVPGAECDVGGAPSQRGDSPTRKSRCCGQSPSSMHTTSFAVNSGDTRKRRGLPATRSTNTMPPSSCKSTVGASGTDTYYIRAGREHPVTCAEVLVDAARLCLFPHCSNHFRFRLSRYRARLGAIVRSRGGNGGPPDNGASGDSSARCGMRGVSSFERLLGEAMRGDPRALHREVASTACGKSSSNGPLLQYQPGSLGTGRGGSFGSLHPSSWLIQQRDPSPRIKGKRPPPARQQ